MAERASEIGPQRTPANSPPPSEAGPRSSDLLMPVMNVETNVAFDLDGKPVPGAATSPVHRVAPAFNSCAVIYTAADAKPKPPPVIRPPTAKYGSHETLPTAARAKPRLTRAHSEQVDGDETKAGGAARWGVLQAKTVGTTPLARKDKRRAAIVAAVTRRLFSVKKKSEETSAAAEPAEVRVEEADDQEPEELKICARARASLKAMVSRRRRLEAETQTDFAAHTLRVKEIAVATDETACRCDHPVDRKSVATQCSRVAGLVDEVYRRWWHHYGNGAAWQRVFVTQHRFVAGEDEFSDDSLDSNPDGEGKVGDGERPCVWKVLTITSGQHFGRVDGTKPDMKVSPRPTPRIAALDNIKPTPGNDETAEELPTKVCCCRDSIGAMQAAIESLQQSLREKNDKPETSCFIRLCDGGCPRETAERRSKGTQTTIVTTCAATQCCEADNDVTGGKACSCALCRSHQKIKSFVYRWKDKCRVMDEVDVRFAMSDSSRYSGSDRVESEGGKSRRESGLPCEGANPENASSNRFPISFIEVPFAGNESSTLPGMFKPCSQTLNEELMNNNNNTKCGEGHPDSKCAAVQQCYFPVMMNNNGRTSVMGFVKDQEHQTFFLPVLTSSELQTSKHPSVREGSPESSARTFGSNKDPSDLFREDGDVVLPRSDLAGMRSASDAIDGIIRQRIDAEKRHWLEIKSVILGRERSVTPPPPNEESERRFVAARKRVTWRDYRGCGDLVEVRPLPPRDDDYVERRPDREWDKSRLEGVSRRENGSNNNAPNINLTFYPFVNAKQKCDQHNGNYGSRIYLFDSKCDEKPKLFKRIFKSLDHETPTSQKGKIMNMFHSRSKYYEEKLAQLSLLRERRQKGQASGERPDDSSMPYVNVIGSAPDRVVTKAPFKPCASKSSEQTGWSINVEVMDNRVQIGQKKPFEIRSESNCCTNLVDTNSCKNCACVRRKNIICNCRQKCTDIHDRIYILSPERNCNHVCDATPCLPYACDVGTRTECDESFGSKQFERGLRNRESSHKNVALPSKYMRHLLDVRRQIVGTPKD